MKSIYDSEIIREIKNDINDGAIILKEDTQSYFNYLEELYPIGFSGINWTEKGYIYFDKIGSYKNEQEAYIFNFLKKIALWNPNLLNDEIVVIGDGLTEIAYCMTFSKFIDVWRCFLLLPQHSYILFIENRKCINLTFEGELFFG